MGVYHFSSNLPAPINVGPDPQTKTGNLIIEGVLRLGQFTTVNAPSGAEGALYYDTSEKKVRVYSDGAWNDLVGVAKLDLGSECSLDGDCNLGHCVDGVCCNSSCANICEACNLVGTVGLCTVRPADDDGGCAICKTCDGVSNTVCGNKVNNTQVTGCTGTCVACQSGICGAATSGTDPGNDPDNTLENLICSITSGSCANTIVFKMYATSNAHAELSGQVNYSNYACCSGVTGLGNSCSGNYDTVLKLYGTTNSHVEKSTQSNYANSVCLSVSSGSTIVCDYATDCVTLGSRYACVASISGDTNAHVGDCDDYSTKVCCSTMCE